MVFDVCMSWLGWRWWCWCYKRSCKESIHYLLLCETLFNQGVSMQELACKVPFEKICLNLKFYFDHISLSWRLPWLALRCGQSYVWLARLENFPPLTQLFRPISSKEILILNLNELKSKYNRKNGCIYTFVVIFFL